jgi:hypothetical protein
MKIKTFVLSIILFSSCEDIVRFEVPQPQGRPNEKSIPKKFFGTYASLTDSDSLVVTKTQIISFSEFDIASELDSADRAKYKGDTVFSAFEGSTKARITIINDSVFEHVDVIDTLFDFAQGDILRKFKGYYFLNHETSKNKWFVTRLGITKKGLVLGTISNSKELENLRELTNTKSDTIYNFNPTRKELKKIVKNGGFKNEKQFVKIQ